MGRRKKGRNVSGWMVVDKPAGMTSTAVVGKVRWALSAAKAGHAGTLDPAATGVLAVALGEATKTVPFITEALKAYRFTVRFGQATSTDDAEGAVIATSERRPDDAEIIAALPDFVGDIMQVPPKYSAVKVDGARAYALARGGADPDLAARPLYVDELTLIDRPDPDHATFEFICGKGGYVRAIARDLGQKLGCLGHVVALRRVWSGPFDAADAISIDRIEALAGTPDLDALLLPLEIALQGMPRATVNETGVVRLKNGNPGQVVSTDCEYGDTCWASFRGRPVAIGTYRAGELHPSRVFNLDE